MQLELDAEVGVADWEAVFDLYAEELGMMLTGLGDLATLTTSLRFADRAVVGCGDHWPHRAVTLAGYTTGEDRRVDVFLLPADDLPDLEHPTPGEDLYATQRYHARGIPEWPIVTRTRVQLRDAQGAVCSDIAYELTGLAAAHAGTTDAHGFTEEFVAHPGDVAQLHVADLVYRIRVAAEPARGLSFAQSVLNSLGYYAGTTDGSMRRSTRAALRNFQRICRLPITGELDPATEHALRAAAWRS